MSSAHKHPSIALIGHRYRHTHTHTDLPPTDSHRHKSFSSIEYEKSLPFCCHICCFRFPPTAAQTSSSHFGWDFSFRPSPQFLFTFFCDLLKGSQQLINFVLCMGISLSPFPYIFFLNTIAIFYVWAEQFLQGFHVKQFPLLTYKFLKYFTKINFGLWVFWGTALPLHFSTALALCVEPQCKKLIKMSLKCLNF